MNRKEKTSISHERMPDVRRLRVTLTRYCLSLTKSRWDAEDLVQETCLRALRVMQGLEGHANPEAYLLRIAKNAWIDHCRKAGREEAWPEQAGEDPGAAASMTAGLDVETAFGILLRRMPPLQCVVWILRDLFGYTNAGAARLLTTSEGAVKAALHRAREALKDVREATGEQGWQREDAEVDADLLKAYVSAFQAGDAAGLVRLIRLDAAEPAAAIGQVLAHAIDAGSFAGPQALWMAA